MRPYLSGEFGNPSSLSQEGQRARRAVEEAREKVAAFVEAGDPSEILFTSSGTEANNMAIKGAAHALRKKGRSIFASAIEHPSVLSSLQFLTDAGWKTDLIPVDQEGRAVLPSLASRLKEAAAVLVSVMHANNEVGTIQPVSEISEIAHQAGAIFHCDAVQTAAKVRISVDEIGADLLSLSAHKIYGPKGAAALYIREGTPMSALIHGGSQEKRRRAGTENVAAIVGMGKACELAQAHLAPEIARLEKLRDQLERAIVREIPAVKINGAKDTRARLCNTLNISLEGLEAEGLILAMDLEGIAVSSGSACSSGSLEQSHVLSAMGLSRAASKGSLRFSLGKDTAEKDIDHALGILKQVVARLRAMSPLWNKKKEVLAAH